MERGAGGETVDSPRAAYQFLVESPRNTPGKRWYSPKGAKKNGYLGGKGKRKGALTLRGR